jgi:hypothetical protein
MPPPRSRSSSRTDADTQDSVQVDYVANSGSIQSAVGSNGAAPPASGFSLNAATGEVSYDRGAFGRKTPGARPGSRCESGVAIDPDNPPIYESQASYLERHGLFLPGERRRLKPADFEPERVCLHASS